MCVCVCVCVCLSKRKRESTDTVQSARLDEDDDDDWSFTKKGCSKRLIPQLEEIGESEVSGNVSRFQHVFVWENS